MDIVQMIIVSILIVIWPRKGTLIEHFKFKIGFSGLECEISAKQKNCPPTKKDSSSIDN